MLVFNSITVSLYSDQALENIDQQLRNDMVAVRRLLRFNADGILNTNPQSAQTSLVYESRNSIRYAVRNTSGHTLRFSINMVTLGPPLPKLENKTTPIIEDMWQNQSRNGERHYRLLSVLYPHTAHDGNQDLILQVLRPLSNYDIQRNELVTLLFSLSPLPLILVILGSFWVSRLALKPVNTLITAVSSISAHDLTTRLPPSSNDELGQLTENFNQMLERLEQSFESLTSFTANASHELRTPLTALRTQAEVALSQSRSSQDYQNVLGSLLEDMGHLEHLINTLLHLARCDAGLVQLSVQHFNFSERISYWLDTLSVLLAEKNIHLINQCASDITINADQGAIDRIIVNLLDNAICYTPADGKITLSLVKENNNIIFTVSDTGPGIPNHLRNDIFDRFVRLQKTRHESSGAGLGLAIVNRAIELHHGSITVDNNVDVGACFSVQLPFQQDD